VSKKNPIVLSKGLVLLAKEGTDSKVRRALICRVGVFSAGTGEVDVTEELLQRIADFHNLQRSNPKNENDFPPILVDHERKADNTKGRLLSNVTVEVFPNEVTGDDDIGLFGDLRVDDDEAKKKVETGVYSQVSLSFDEDTGEIYEVSFVAVEAARRSQLLSQSQGEKEMGATDNKVELALQKAKSRITSLKSASKSVALSAAKNIELAMGESKKIAAVCELAITAAKTATLSSQFKGFVREGKITPAEYKELKMSELAALPESSIKHLLSSYSTRAVSADVRQHGHSDAKPLNPVKLSKLTPDQIRKAAELQKSGKGGVALAQDEDEGTDEESKKKLAEKEDDKKEGGKEYTMEDMAEISRHMGNAQESLAKLNEHITGMGDMLKKLSESATDDNKSKDEEEGE
jgi:hypothetical protein